MQTKTFQNPNRTDTDGGRTITRRWTEREKKSSITCDVFLKGSQERRRRSKSLDMDARFLAKILGYAGALPFLVLSPPALERMIETERNKDVAEKLQVAYGASILSFLGAVHWGCVLTKKSPIASFDTKRMAWSVVPSLIAWPTTALPTDLGAATLAAGTSLCYAVDVGYARKNALPIWYARLRLPLTMLAVSGLLSTSYRRRARDSTPSR